MSLSYLPQHPTLLLFVFFASYIILVHAIRKGRGSPLLILGMAIMAVVVLYVMDMKLENPMASTLADRARLQKAFQELVAQGHLNHMNHATYIMANDLPDTLTWCVQDDAVVRALLQVHDLARVYDIQVFVCAALYAELFYALYRRALVRPAEADVPRMKQLRSLMINHVQTLHVQSHGVKDAAIRQAIQVLQRHTYHCLKKVGGRRHLYPTPVVAAAPMAMGGGSFEWHV